MRGHAKVIDAVAVEVPSLLDRLADEEPNSSVFGIPLRLRRTFRYPGTHQNHDRWSHIGTMDEIGRHKIYVQDDTGECWEIFCSVHAGKAPLSQVRQALIDSYSCVGCSHQTWVPCNCISYIAGRAERVTGHTWRTTVHLFNPKQKRS